ncbi:MAG: sulfur carrier protein ThiS [Leptospiraceae bacterium]
MIVNGEKHPVDSENLMDFIKSLGLDPRTVAVEKNGEIVRRETWEATKLLEEDKLEVIRFVGGG